MKTPLIIGLLIAATFVGHGQAPEAGTKVRIKKIEKINGVEKTTDTTYVVQGPLRITELEDLPSSAETGKKDGPGKIIIITDEIHGESDHMREISLDDAHDARIVEALKAAGVNGEKGVEMICTVKEGKKGSGSEGEKNSHIVIIKQVRVSEPSESDKKLLKGVNGLADNQLDVKGMSFYPNPSDGKFTLSFDLVKKDDTEVSIFDMEGREVYNERLPSFSGHYEKQMDISKEAKGVYFVKIAQGEHSDLKKIILD